MKAFVRIFALLIIVMLCTGFACAEDTVLEPQWPVPEYVTHLLEIASGEVGYTEGAHGYSKYGEWAEDPYCQWCAEFLCWCVDQVDKRYSTKLLRNVYPLYSGSNGGVKWFISQGRYITRNGHLTDWGYQWMDGDTEYITTGTYIPQPGDWVFFTWTSDEASDHVALVEYCTRDDTGTVTIHVIEGNNPSSVQRNTYALTYNRILGYGTVYDVAGWTMRSGNTGEKVRQLQEKLVTLGYLTEEQVDGSYGTATAEAIQAYQATIGEKQSGIATMTTQQRMDRDITRQIYESPETLIVVDDDDD